MKVLVIGSGAREHAICWRLKRARGVSHVVAAPGNPGMESVAQCVSVTVTAVNDLLALVAEHQIDLTVVGPEAALAVGIVDAFEAAGCSIVGPTREAALLESSKSFAKEVMVAAGVPTAHYELCTSRTSLEEYCKTKGAPLVLKSDGLASGKGVFVIQDPKNFSPAFDQLFGELRAEKVVVEDFLSGFEVSCIFASNGAEVLALAPAHDYKRLKDNDQGPNTGGMGAVCPTPRISLEDLTWIEKHCAQPIIDTMAKRGTPFRGFLYAGLMIDPEKPREVGIKVLEYNTRLGDPECQAIMTRLTSDPVELFLWICGRSAARPSLEWDSKVATCVVVASDGYPEAPVKGDRISGLEFAGMVPDAMVFHASTQRNSSGEFVTGGGRTLSIVALGKTAEESRHSAYKLADMVQLRGRRMRRDIGL
jgi:phosphoribosylamine--glycine ligase